MVTFSWSGQIQGEDPNFTATGTATFYYDGAGTLTLTMTNTTSDLTTSPGEVLTGLTWDDPQGFTYDPISAVLGSTSMLVGMDAGSYPGLTDLSGEWGFIDDLNDPMLGSFAVGSMGDVNFHEGFGPNDRFDTTSNPFPPPSGSLNGISGGIVNDNFCDTCATFMNGNDKGPLVQDTMVLSWNVDPDFDVEQITNVVPLFGTDGAPLIPEPTSVLLFAVGMLFTAQAVNRRR
jgi:hypothetical protein